MNKYKIADLIIELDCDNRTMKQAEKYKINNCQNNTDLALITSDNTVLAKSKYGEKATPIKALLPKYMYTHLAEGKSFYRKLISDFNGMMLHASAIVVDNNAYLFSAPSGTGKSTHTELWIQKFGNRAYILNDDKPAVRILEDGIYAYGTPWSGKHDISANKKVSLKAICFLQRDDKNWIEPITGQEAVINMFLSSIRKIDKEEMTKLMDIINTIICKVPIYKMGCKPELEAAEMSYNIMSN